MHQNYSHSTSLFPHLLNNSQLQCLRQQAKHLLSYYSKQNQIDYMHALLQKKIQIQKELVQKQIRPQTKGRGGNNIAQNIKKAFLAILKKKIKKSLFNQIQERFITPYNIKSQKQNLVMFFLFLSILQNQHKITKQLINQLEKQIKTKISKYIQNSQERMKNEIWRHQFHEKNIKQFKKFLTLNLNFTHQINLEEISSQMQPFFLRKKLECNKAENKIKRVIEEYACLTSRKNINSQASTNSFVVSSNSSFQTVGLEALKESLSDSPQTD